LFYIWPPTTKPVDTPHVLVLLYYLGTYENRPFAFESNLFNSYIKH